ncbi:MAG: DHH family phosphoesterase [Thermoanaerobaculia bacterium]|nr:DHH family phosphoesterase [Thermoanaerobaculia bacterium]
MPPSDTAERLELLAETMESAAMRGHWLVLMHDNPDPDAIASAAGLSRLLRAAYGREVTTAYGGIIGRAENREMVRLLRIKMSHVRQLDWKHYRHFALVDTQPQTGNNQLPDDRVPEIVLDHHPLRARTRRAAFHDVRPEYGATATIVAEYLREAGVDLSRQLATALLYAIRTETQEFRRDFCEADRELHEVLVPLADSRALGRIQTPRLPLSYFHNLHGALESLEGVGTLIVSHLHEIDQPDIVPELADLLVRLEGKTWALCTGRFGDRLYLSLRTTNTRADAGQLMRRLVGTRGKGGGHGMTAGGWVALEKAPGGDAESLERHLAGRLAKYLKKNPQRIAPIPMQLRSADPPDTT